jgi:hypothetical protein
MWWFQESRSSHAGIALAREDLAENLKMFSEQNCFKVSYIILKSMDQIQNQNTAF